MITIEKKAELTGHANPIFTAELSRKPGILFTGGNDKGVVEWSLKNNAFIKVLFPVAASIYSIHCPANFPYLFAGLRNGDVLVFDFLKQQIICSLKHHQLPVFDIKSLSHKNELVVASEDGTASVWDLNTLNLLFNIKVSNDTIRSIALSPDEKQIVFGCRDTSIQVYDSSEYAKVSEIKGHTMAVFSVQFSPKGDYIISGGRDAQLKIWDSASFKLLHSIPAHMFAVNSIAFHPAQPYFASASMDKTIKIWGANDFKLYKIISREKGFESHQLSVNKVVWNGDNLLSVSDDKRVIVWDVQFDD
jgi:centriolar protein POC1